MENEYTTGPNFCQNNLEGEDPTDSIQLSHTGNWKVLCAHLF